MVQTRSRTRQLEEGRQTHEQPREPRQKLGPRNGKHHARIEKNSGDVNKLQASLGTSFATLPNELRLMIADYLPWNDFHAYRTLDKTNYRLLTTERIERGNWMDRDEISLVTDVANVLLLPPDNGVRRTLESFLKTAGIRVRIAEYGFFDYRYCLGRDRFTCFVRCRNLYEICRKLADPESYKYYEDDDDEPFYDGGTGYGDVDLMNILFHDGWAFEDKEMASKFFYSSIHRVGGDWMEYDNVVADESEEGSPFNGTPLWTHVLVALGLRLAPVLLAGKRWKRDETAPFEKQLLLVERTLKDQVAIWELFKDIYLVTNGLQNYINQYPGESDSDENNLYESDSDAAE
ncbi:hypothetical protein BJ508DRAFT_320363 [Ascobolus immersus RN42]|uniref:F-box domain-containing protein n=1 Tax=Ascobolus immersus RN42 TaxID=1160509 RepID=A0A3N4IPZ7_ASCIM|nr:hypothetical protein BJ508DRAFT_320363 [Ascobolus immersus RN42]